MQARRYGVTRLAEITALDAIGLPVWQSIRPASRALSVHQGKGRTSGDAKLGALGEAIESAAAETTPPDIRDKSYLAIGRSMRAVAPGLFRKRDEDRPDNSHIRNWSAMTDIVTGEAHLVPHASVSMDFTIRADSALDRSSNGMGAGKSRDDATAKGLLECIERDATGAWFRRPLVLRQACEIDPDTLPDGWADPWAERLHDIGIALRVFALPTLTGIACFVCVLIPGLATRPIGRPVCGSACASDPREALFGALAEAVQSRLTLIAAARDDIAPDFYLPSPLASPGFPFCPPLAPDSRRRDWNSLSFETGNWLEQASRLGKAGFGSVLARWLTPSSETIQVAKVIVPGLGTLFRRRVR